MLFYLDFPIEINVQGCYVWFSKQNKMLKFCYNSFFASCEFCHLLITFANSLASDQDHQKVEPNLDPYCLTLS